MHKRTWLAVLLVLLMAPSLAAAQGADKEAPSWEEMALQRHNEIRQGVGAAALAWSADLAAFAQVWADELAKKGCVMEHRPPEGAFAQRYGENIYWGSARIYASGRREVDPMEPATVVDAWAGEVQWYDYDTNACAPPQGQSCGHYTQVVWAKSTAVGCARSICEDKGQIWVCNYDPPGNMMDEKPY